MLKACLCNKENCKFSGFKMKFIVCYVDINALVSVELVMAGMVFPSKHRGSHLSSSFRSFLFNFSLYFSLNYMKGSGKGFLQNPSFNITERGGAVFPVTSHPSFIHFGYPKKVVT